MSSGPRVAILFEGTRGDSQPYIIAGRALLDSGFEVLVAGAEDFGPMAADFGVPFIAYLPPAKDIWTCPDAVKGYSNNDIASVMAAGEKVMKEAFAPGMRKLLSKLQEFKPEIIMAGLVNHLHIMAFSHILDCAGLFLGLQCTLPSNYTEAFGILPYFPPCTGLNKRAWKLLAKLAVYDVATKEHLPVLEEVSGMSREQFWPTFDDYVGCYLPDPEPMPFPLFLAASSVLNQPLPLDFTAKHLVLGPLIPKEEDLKGEDFGGPERSALEAFLGNGPPPVYIGFGSMIYLSGKVMTLLCMRALKIAGERGVLCAGWADLSPQHLKGEPDEEELLRYADKNVLFVQSAPHVMLFPRCKAIVHHGGAGTLNAAIRSGVPSAICPVATDQFTHSTFVNNHGIGVGLKGWKTATPYQLADAIKRCAESQEIRRAAREMADALRLEDGPGQFVESLRRYYQEEVATGRHREVAKERFRRLGQKKKLAMLAWCC